ncbi:MAG TPA: cytochrome c oxidase subunit 3 [Candidatus Polarisedimenticolaceae bacterium]|nr:cytochrome c oxidase subunit 3 [Candidatus Polarisedimenticolaceae bacterium]
MSVAPTLPPPVRHLRPAPHWLPDRSRGTAGMALFITTEAALFGLLFLSALYLSGGHLTWPGHEPPRLRLVIPMTALLLASSLVLYRGERAAERGRRGRAFLALWSSVGLGVLFLVLQVFETRDHLRHLSPSSNAYGSIFYATTGFHGLHLIVGLLMLAYAGVLGRTEPTERPPHRPYRNAALYWHFVDAVWIVILAVLYLPPNLR